MPNTNNGTRTTSESQPHIYTGSDIEALADLSSSGAHLVLADQDKHPIREGWLARPPSTKSVRNHISNGGLVGVVPWSLRCSLVDIDAGAPSDLLTTHSPVTGWATRRPGGVHLLYRDTEGRGNSKFDLYGCQGDIRGKSGYAVLWGNAATTLVEALEDIPQSDRYLPLEFVNSITSGFSAYSGLEGVQREGKATIDLCTVWEGQRNTSLFQVVRLWSYAQPKGYNEDAWNAHVRAFAIDANQAMPIPLDADEVHTLAYSVSTWAWNHRTYAPGKAYDHTSELQRLRAYKKDWNLWRKNLPRNLKIRELADQGVPQREIGRRFGLSRGAVEKVLAKWKSLA